MSTTTQVRRTGPGRGGERPAGSSEGPPSPVQAAPVAAATTARRYRVMFAVPFQTAMSDADIHRAQQRARHGYAPAPQASRESRQPRRVTSGLLLRPVPGPRQRASGLAIGGSHVGSAGAGKRSGLAPGRGRRRTAAGSHGPGAAAARDPWPTNDHRHTEQCNSSSVEPFALQPAAAQGGRPPVPRTTSNAGARPPVRWPRPQPEAGAPIAALRC